MGGAYGNGGLGSKSTLSKSKISFSGSWQCCKGFSPGTLRLSSNGATSIELPKSDERAETVAVAVRRVVARKVRNLMLDNSVCAIFWCFFRGWCESIAQWEVDCRRMD